MQNVLIFTVGLVAVAVGVAMLSVPAALIVTGMVLMFAVVVVSCLPTPPPEKDTPKQ
jgi:uncharacterized membrane-anchored protein YitT (DUF2179 family)